MRILKEDLRINILRKMEAQLSQKAGSNLYIWGCASTAGMIAAFIEKNSRMEPAAYIVDDLYYKDAVFCGKKVYKASQWRRIARKGDYVVMGFTGSKRAKEVILALPDGIEGIYFYFPYSCNAYATCLSYEDYEREQERFSVVFDMLCDEISKKTMEAFINGCITGDVGKLDELQTDGQYFNELTRNCEVQYLVDCGAYVGDTVEAAVSFYKERVKGIISFEPDENNIRRLKERVQKLGFADDRLYLIPKGSWSGRATLHFASDNSSSSISEDGDLVIEVDSVDHVVDSLNKPIGFLKIDVEGSEKETLRGAAGTIQKYHPLLAVCVYHRPEDLYELPETICELSKEHPYHFYLRYHGPDLRELVLYAL